MLHTASRRNATRLTLAASLALLLSACGGAGSSGPDALGGIDASASATQPAQVTILTTSVPTGQPGVPYPSATLLCTGGDGPIAWDLVAGTLPPGLNLESLGRLTGTPQAQGFYTFTVEATDGATADRQSLAVAIDAFGLGVVEGLTFGDAWSGRRVHLRTAGHTSSVIFQAVGNGSRGYFERVDGVAGTAVWVPGAVDTNGALDVIRVTDPAADRFTEVEIPVASDPLAEHVARFGTTDVWFIDWTAKTGLHPYANDFHAALAQLGLRNPASTGVMGTEADQLAELLVKAELLRHLNPMFLRARDGSAGPEGLPISFAFDRPGEGYAAPQANTWMSGRSNGYSIMALCDQSGHLAAVGYAFGDAVGNPRHEHNAPKGDSELGVFVNYVAQSVERSWRLYGEALRTSPVTNDDIPALKALLHERSDVGGRYELLGYFARAFAVDTAAVVAHEVGHSIGLPHTGHYIPGDIMNSVVVMGPGADHVFTAEALDILRLGLPGAGRGGVASQKIAGAPAVASALPAGGVVTCEHCANGR